MENVSILDQIISNQKAEEVAKLNVVEIVNNLFNELTDRERNVLSRRFGLQGKDKETLEIVGNDYNLTRERIRQIESFSIKKLKKLKKLDNYVDELKKVIIQLLEEHGGLMEKIYLLDVLSNFSSAGDSGEGKEIKHKNNLDFLISKLLHDKFEELDSSRNFKNSYKLKYQKLSHLEELIEELVSKIEEDKKTFKTEDLINLLLSLETYQNNKEKFNSSCNIDISNMLKNDFFKENADVINKNKTLYSILVSAKKIEQNKFGYWGFHNWREIKPKTINDKIYLVLKNHEKPMHFIEVADQINKIEFDSKKANAATVHNELILDNKYVLVGRGIYGLKDWGYQKGTVADVIREILSLDNGPLSRDEIIQKVLEKRLVKKTTIVLALMNRDAFNKIDGKYALKEK